MKIRPLLLTLGSLLVAIVLSIVIGSVQIPLGDVWRVLTGRMPLEVSGADIIVLTLRLPRTMLILLTGAALGATGAAYQAIFRNPLADPYLIGTASGAGLGAVLAMSVKWPYTTPGLLAVPAAAFIGALLAVFLVYLLARVGKTVPTTNLILAGVAVSAFTTAVTTFLMLRSDGELRRAIAWLAGGSTFTGWQPVLIVLPFLLTALGGLLLSGHHLNVLQFGDDQARQLGLSVGRTRALVLIAASLATAAAVAFSGIIGFVGLIVPHLMRMWFGADHRRLLPLAMTGGAAFLLLADVLARVVLASQELPVGIVTALAGAPFFVWVLRRAKNPGYW
jgi:iron complex transport system permease protein